APPDRPKKRAVKLGDFTALRPFRRRGAFSTGRKQRERTLARPRERVVGGGATDAGDTLHLVSPQPFAKGTAIKRDCPPLFTHIKTIFLLLAALSASRTSSTLETVLPAIFRMTSPSLKP